jgi:hypothetical protein
VLRQCRCEDSDLDDGSCDGSVEKKAGVDGVSKEKSGSCASKLAPVRVDWTGEPGAGFAPVAVQKENTETPSVSAQITATRVR